MITDGTKCLGFISTVSESHNEPDFKDKTETNDALLSEKYFNTL